MSRSVDYNLIINNYDKDIINIFNQIIFILSKYDYKIDDNRDLNKVLKFILKMIKKIM